LRDIETIDSELRLVAALRHAARERGGPMPSIDVADALLDERARINGASLINKSSAVDYQRRLIGMAGKFEISKDKSGEFRFHLNAPNGEIIASSQGYKSKDSAENGIKSVQTHAPGATVVDQTG